MFVSGANRFFSFRGSKPDCGRLFFAFLWIDSIMPDFSFDDAYAFARMMQNSHIWDIWDRDRANGTILPLFYHPYNSPSSYRQPSGKGQSLSRRYCKHSEWLFSSAYRTARKFHGALAVSCKNFKQSKWPFEAAFQHADSLNSSYLRSTRYSSI